MTELVKYPRTHHLEGSRVQPGDEDLAAVEFASIASRPLVVEEKLDGANAAVRFDEDGELLLQSRGHFLRGGARERHFDLFKAWARSHAARLFAVLGRRYVMFGEWLYAKHTVFYDRLPHYFLEFDLLDVEADTFLSTPRRHELLAGSPVASVPVLFEGALTSVSALQPLVGKSLYKTEHWQDNLGKAASVGESGQWGCLERTVAQTDPSDLAEGLYLKVEEGGVVTGRYKFVRPSFVTAVVESDGHWLNRPIVENRLAEGVDIFAPELP